MRTRARAAGLALGALGALGACDLALPLHERADDRAGDAADAGSDARFDARTWCSDHPATLCADFDEPLLVTGWDQIEPSPGADLVADPSLSTSPPPRPSPPAPRW